MVRFEAFHQRQQGRLMAGMSDEIARLSWNGEQIAARQRAGLRALLTHAIAKSPFHAERLKGVDPATFELSDLAALPVMSKAQMMAAFDEVVTDRRLNLSLVEQAIAATTDTPHVLFDRYVAFASGGSSGVRGLFVLDEDALVAFGSALMRPSLARLAAAGGPPPGGLRAAMVAASSAVHVTGCAPALTAGGPIAFVAVPVTLPLTEIVARLNAMQPHILYGYPSMLARLAHEQAQGRLAIRPMAITATSETLTADHRAAISTGFRAPLTNGFGATEGLVGQSEPDEEPLTFNSDSCIVELVDDAYRPAPPGVASSRLLLTNLANLTQPLIRYEIGDRFIQLPQADGSGHLRAIVEGRGSDVLRYGEVAIHPLVIGSVILRHQAASDYQVRQTPRGVDVSVLAAGSVSAGLVSELRAALAAAGLPGAEVRVRVVEALEPHPQTGKLRRFVPLGADELLGV